MLPVRVLAPRQLLTHTAYVKAAARDIKAYLRSINSNALVGYAAVDGEADFRDAVAHYMTCGNDTETIDLYGESQARLAALTIQALTTTSGAAPRVSRRPTGTRSPRVSPT